MKVWNPKLSQANFGWPVLSWKKGSFHDFWNSVGGLQISPRNKISFPTMLYQETEQLRSKVQVMWVNGRILHPLQLEKTIKNSRGWGKYRYSLAQNFHNLQYLPYWQGSKNSSWKTCLAVDETAAKLISDKLSCQRFVSKITWDSWPKSDVWIDNKQNGWNIMRDMFPAKTNPSGTLTRWRNLRACLNSERHWEFWVMRK